MPKVSGLENNNTLHNGDFIALMPETAQRQFEEAFAKAYGTW